MSQPSAPKNELLIYLSNYYCIGSLYPFKTSITFEKIKLPPLCFIKNHPNLWNELIKEFSSRFKVAEFSNIHLSTSHISKELEGILPKEVREKKILVSDEIKRLDIPLVPLEATENVNITDAEKWFPYNESYETIENSLMNRILFGPITPSSEWEKAIESSLLRQVVKDSTSEVEGEIKKFEELYFSGSLLFNCDNCLDILLAILDSIDISGLWTIYTDGSAVLLSLLPKMEKADLQNTLSSIKLYPLCHLFVAPDAEKARVVFDDENEHLLNLAKQGIYAIPITEGKKVKINMAFKKTKFEKTFGGSKYGLIFDTRSRPLEYAQIKSERLKNADNVRKQLGVF